MKTKTFKTDLIDLAYWPCPYGKPEIVTDCFVKVDGGVKHLVMRYPKKTFRPSDAIADCMTHGHYSERPYVPGQRCDGSINDCALALFFRWCQAHGHDPNALYARAYPDEKHELPDWPEVLRCADWQGVAYPEQWTPEAEAATAESLTEINFHSLRAVFDELRQK